MNEGRIVRADVDEDGVRIRVWVDDETGRHLTVCECRIGDAQLSTWYRELDAAQHDAQQYQFDFH